MHRPGKALTTGPACAAFRQHLAGARGHTPPLGSWSLVQADFLRAMEAFDAEVVAGRATEGERQNGKGDYFNDLLALILGHATGVDLAKRRGVPGLTFPNHNLDVTYPSDGSVVEVLVEAKMLGTPQHPGNASTQRPEGRPGSADMLKRCKEAGFKTIDLKAGFGMLQSQAGLGQQQGISGDLTTWLRTAKPKSYLVVAVRVVSDQDARAAIAMGNAMTQVMDGVGLYLYRPRGYQPSSLAPPSYETVAVPTNVELVRVLQRLGSDLRAAQASPSPMPTATLPSVAVAAALDGVESDTLGAGEAPD